jgi:hypothetical protein
MSEKKQTREVVIRGSGGIEVSRDEKEDVSEGGMSRGTKAFIAFDVIIMIFMLIYFIGSGS